MPATFFFYKDDCQLPDWCTPALQHCQTGRKKKTKKKKGNNKKCTPAQQQQNNKAKKKKLLQKDRHIEDDKGCKVKGSK